MSVHVSSAVWRANLPPTDKLVMLALADISNDDWRAYPSNKTLTERTGLSQRAVQMALSRLEAAGHLIRDMRSGRSTVCHIMVGRPPHLVHPRTSCTPAEDAPTPARRAPTPARRAPITVTQPSKNQQTRAVALPSWLPTDAWTDWEAYRKTRKGWTAKARELSLRTLCKLHEEGHDPRRVIEESIERGWAGLFPLKGEAMRSTNDLTAGAV